MAITSFAPGTEYTLYMPNFVPVAKDSALKISHLGASPRPTTSRDYFNNLKKHMEQLRQMSKRECVRGCESDTAIDEVDSRGSNLQCHVSHLSGDWMIGAQRAQLFATTFIRTAPTTAVNFKNAPKYVR